MIPAATRRARAGFARHAAREAPCRLTRTGSPPPIMPIYSFAFVLALACAGFFYRAGDEEGSSGLVWGGASLVVSLFVMLRLDGGMLGVALAQLGVLASIVAFRLWRDPH